MKDHRELPEITLRNARLHGDAIKPEPSLRVGRWAIRILLEDGKQPIEMQRQWKWDRAPLTICWPP